MKKILLNLSVMIAILVCNVQAQDSLFIGLHIYDGTFPTGIRIGDREGVGFSMKQAQDIYHTYGEFNRLKEVYNFQTQHVSVLEQLTTEQSSTILELKENQKYLLAKSDNLGNRVEAELRLNNDLSEQRTLLLKQNIDLNNKVSKLKGEKVFLGVLGSSAIIAGVLLAIFKK